MLLPGFLTPTCLERAPSIALTAFSCMLGSTWEYVSNVMDMFACPCTSFWCEKSRLS